MLKQIWIFPENLKYILIHFNISHSVFFYIPWNFCLPLVLLFSWDISCQRKGSMNHDHMTKDHRKNKKQLFGKFNEKNNSWVKKTLNFPWVTLCHWGGLDVKCPKKSSHLNTWCPDGGPVWEGLGVTALVKKVYQWGVSFGINILVPLVICSLCFMLEVQDNEFQPLIPDVMTTTWCHPVPTIADSNPLEP